MLRSAARAWLRGFGWTVTAIDPMPPKMVFIAAPHTSNWDVPFMLAAAWALPIRLSWLGKHTLFRGALAGRLMKAVGGIPIDRRSSSSTVSRIAGAIRREPGIYLAISPEGTRGGGKFWRSGFYHIAREAGVPIGLGYLDYGRRRAGVGGLLNPSGDVRADMDVIRAFYRDIRGKRPELETVPRLREEQAGVPEPEPVGTSR
jgi:1-acyl-sn-glycerol-3-phosphate acyltransferase